MKNSMTISMMHSGSENKKGGLKSQYDKLLAEFKREQTGYSTIAIIGQSCIGSAAAMMLLMNEMAVFPKLLLLFLVTIFCMAYNGAVLAQLKPKMIFNLLLLSVVFSCGVIIAHLF